MNKQSTPKGRGIEWCDYTWNVIRGCQHACEWTMPDDTTAICYAKEVAEGLAQSAYPQGFAHHYFKPEALVDPARIKKPSRIFLDSMSDLMGAWVPAEQVQQVLDVCAANPQHVFQLLAKNAPRLKRFQFPANVWVGVSAPPTAFIGKQLSLHQQEAYVHRALNVMEDLKAKNQASVTWMSIEPLSFDIASTFIDWLGEPESWLGQPMELPIDWVVIGAATNGRSVYQPAPEWVGHLVGDETMGGVLEGIPVFFKGNLKGNEAATPWREEFPPVVEPRGLF